MHASRIQAAVLLALTAALPLAGCSSSTPVSADAYDLQVALDPAASRIEGVATLHCRVDGLSSDAHRNVVLDLDLNPALTIEQVTSQTATVQRVRTLKTESDEDKPHPQVHRVTLRNAPAKFELNVKYAGKLWQDIEAGEKRGEIHNFTVSAHIGTNGVYLAGGHWYPAAHRDEDADDVAPPLSRFTLALAPVEGYTFVCSASPASGDDGRLHFASAYPQDALTLSGGRYRSWEREDNGIRFAILLNPDGVDDETLERRADLFLSAAVDYMRRYVPLVGPYPYAQFTIVENFFSSGFAFPTYTLLGPMVIAMEDRSLRHGYLDHELLHSWWGNGVYVDPTGGNWCEALTSYAANLHGYVLDGDEAGARKTRRDACNSLSRIPADEDKPLATFGDEGGAGRTVGYQKGSMVFHMLARTIGQENFWQAMRLMTERYTGRYAGWPEMQQIFEEVSGKQLDTFFAQWVYGAGTPELTLTRAWSIPAAERMGADIRQTGTDFQIAVPLRCHFADERMVDLEAPVAGELTTWSEQSYHRPLDIELDPEYHVVRKLSGAEILPTIAGSLRGEKALIVVPAGDGLAEGYQTLIDDIREKRKDKTTEVTSTPTPEQLATHTVIVIGDGLREHHTHNFLRRAECPVLWHHDTFRVEGEVYADPGQAVLCCLRHPDLPGSTITLYYGNSPTALSNAGILWFYGNSLLVFGPPSEAAAGPPPVIRRQDFEHTQRLAVTDGEATPK